MSEAKQLAVAVILTALLAVLGIGVAHIITNQPLADLTADYTAKIIIDKNLTLIEKYTYHVKKPKYRMLFRIWDAPMLINPINLHSPHITLIGVNC